MFFKNFEMNAIYGNKRVKYYGGRLGEASSDTRENKTKNGEKKISRY